MIGVVAVVAVLAGGDDDTAAPGATGTAPVALPTPTSSPSGSVAVASTAPSPTEPASSTTTENTVVPRGAIIGFDLSMELTSFEELPSMLPPQRDGFPDTMQLDVVCGPTKCLVPQFTVVDPILFEVAADKVSVQAVRVLRRTRNDLVCTFVSDQSHEFTRQPDGSYVGTITTTARHLLQATTGGRCYSLNATWAVTFTPRRA
jgi:hypothetical protein